ncbi:MAG: TRAM domain-containing protein, partial [Oscillospiraceae bacterium]|nr:TRAM domain-containing protein [Oscillospiraceae bacterium]
MELKKNDVVTARIEGAASGGEGVARIDGRAVFVKGALPGELCRAHILRVNASAVWAKAEEI